MSDDKKLGTKKRVFGIIGGIVLGLALIFAFMVIILKYFPTEQMEVVKTRQEIDRIFKEVASKSICVESCHLQL